MTGQSHIDAIARRLPRREASFDDAAYWRQDAACRTHDPEAWFSGNDAPEREWAYARSVCKGCPVAGLCLEDALNAGDDHGMFGGKTPRERAEIRAREPRRSAKPILHGTEAGYNRHIREHSAICEACRHAHNVAREQRRVRSGAA